ncbi:hypothetical protein IJ472_04620 [bacterium]|nr:hypothetical protein [bacterium]
MNVTLNTNNFNTQYNYRNNSNNLRKAGISYNQPSFQGGVYDIPQKSKLLSPFKRMFDKVTDFISDNYTMKLYTSKPAQWLSNYTEKLSSVVDHMQVAGSVIISGMYVTQTLRNKDLDEDRRKVLGLNQALTFAISTLGSYVLDRNLDNWWEGVTARFAGRRLGDPDLENKIKSINTNIIKEAETKFGKPWKKLSKKEKPALTTTLKYVENNIKNTNLESLLRGMGVLKKIVVFGTVYRFLSPVAVTPLASWIGNKYFAKKPETTENKAA